MSEKIYHIHDGDERVVGAAFIIGVVGTIAAGPITGYSSQPFSIITEQNNAYNRSFDQQSQTQSHIDALRYSMSHLPTNSPAYLKLSGEAKADQKSLTVQRQHQPAEHTGAIVGEMTAESFAAGFILAAAAQAFFYATRKAGYRSGNMYPRWHKRYKPTSA